MGTCTPTISGRSQMRSILLRTPCGRFTRRMSPDGPDKRFELVFHGAPTGTRTQTGRILSPLPLPIGLWGPGLMLEKGPRGPTQRLPTCVVACYAGNLIYAPGPYDAVHRTVLPWPPKP